MEYTEEFIKEILKKADEIGVREAAKEAGIPWQRISAWKKKAAKADNATSKTAEETEGTAEVDAKDKPKAKKNTKSRKKVTRKKTINEEDAKKNESVEVEGSFSSCYRKCGIKKRKRAVKRAG